MADEDNPLDDTNEDISIGDVEGEQHDTDDEEEKRQPKPLTEEMIGECLSLLTKVGRGLTYAYIKLQAKDRALTDISILTGFIHLRYIDVSLNYLQDISPLSNLINLLWIQGDKNLLTSAQLSDLPYLQMVSFAQNHIKDTEGIGHGFLESLNLTGNEIESVSLDGNKLTKLHILQLAKNRLETTAGINVPNLVKLYLAGNKITDIVGLDNLVKLQTLHLRDNLLEHLDGFTGSLKNLIYLNLRGNRVSVIGELSKLKILPALKNLVLLENPCAEVEAYRLDVLIILRALDKLDKTQVVEEERIDADELLKERMEE